MNIKRQLIIPCTLIGLLILIPIYSVVVDYFKSASTLSLKSTLTEVNLFSHADFVATCFSTLVNVNKNGKGIGVAHRARVDVDACSVGN